MADVSPQKVRILSDAPELEAARLNLSRFFDLTLDLLCVASFEGYFKRLNPAWEKTLGFSRAELLARPYLDLVHPHDRAATATEAQKLAAGTSLVTFENRYRCKDGSYRWLLWNAVPVVRQGLIYAAARDISEHIQRETELRESTARYRSLVEGVPLGVYRTTPAGQILDANSALIEMLGHPDRESLLTTNAAEYYVDPAERGRWQEAVEREARALRHELQLRRRDGTIIWIRNTGQVVRDARGRVLHYQGIWEDITQQKQATEELSKLSSAVEQTADPVIITRVDGTIEFVNAAFEKVTGFTAREAIGHTPCILKSGTHAQEFYRHLWDTIQAGRPWRGTFINRKKDGQVYVAESSIAPILSPQGRITHFVSVERDITERKQAEKALQQYADEISDLYDNAPCGHHSLDAHGTVTRINDTELFWLGFTRDEVIRKKTFGDLLAEDSRKTFEENFSILKERGWVRDLELRMIRKDGTTLPVLMSATAMRDSAGQFSTSRATVYDITQRLALERATELEWRAAQEMETARKVQVRLFPQKAPPLETLEYAGTCSQARVVGGDYYDFLDLSPGRVGLVVADVAGKGLPSALLMASLRADLQSQCRAALRDLPQMLGSVNQLFYDSTHSGVFVSLFFGEYEDASRRLRYANCGHNPPLLVRADGTLEKLAGTGLVLGVLSDWECSVAEVQLSPGDILVIYTDGIHEASNDAGEEFGVARLVEAVRANRHLPVSSLLTVITTAALDFSGGQQEDDQTLILARVR